MTSRRKLHPSKEKYHKPIISLLVPFQSEDSERLKVWHWLKEYWEHELPEAEIIIGEDPKNKNKRWRRKIHPFSKTTAVNNAFRKSKGDIIVILDADAYLPGSVITHCAERIRFARERNVPLWFIPYRSLYRLTQGATKEILESDPTNPLRVPSPPPSQDVEGTDGSGWAHYFGALIQIMPREAFELVGGMDVRFEGWGGEDVAFLLALDILWGRHKNTANDIEHLWHPQLASGIWLDPRGRPWKTRMWIGQTTPRANDRLTALYNNARGDREKMLALVQSGNRRKQWKNIP